MKYVLNILLVSIFMLQVSCSSSKMEQEKPAVSMKLVIVDKQKGIFKLVIKNNTNNIVKFDKRSFYDGLFLKIFESNGKEILQYSPYIGAFRKDLLITLEPSKKIEIRYDISDRSYIYGGKSKKITFKGTYHAFKILFMHPPKIKVFTTSVLTISKTSLFDVLFGSIH